MRKKSYRLLHHQRNVARLLIEAGYAKETVDPEHPAVSEMFYEHQLARAPDGTWALVIVPYPEQNHLNYFVNEAERPRYAELRAQGRLTEVWFANVDSQQYRFIEIFAKIRDLDAIVANEELRRHSRRGDVTGRIAHRDRLLSP